MYTHEENSLNATSAYKEVALPVFLSAINFASCSNDDELSPITLEYEDSNVMRME